MQLTELTVYFRKPQQPLFILETNTDELTRIGNLYQLTSYLEEFGDVEVEFNSKRGVWEVPSLAEKRKKFIAAKMADCERWGAE
jgi:hypothetical protein